MTQHCSILSRKRDQQVAAGNPSATLWDSPSHFHTTDGAEQY